MFLSQVNAVILPVLLSWLHCNIGGSLYENLGINCAKQLGKRDYQLALFLFSFLCFLAILCKLPIREAGSWVSLRPLGKSLLSVYRLATDRPSLACSAKNPRYDLINLFY